MCDLFVEPEVLREKWVLLRHSLVRAAHDVCERHRLCLLVDSYKSRFPALNFDIDAELKKYKVCSLNDTISSFSLSLRSVLT